MESLPVVFDKNDSLMALVGMVTPITVPIVTEPAHYISAGETLKEVKGLFKRIDEMRKEMVAPIDAQREAVQEWFRPYLAKCAEAEKGIKAAMIAYATEQERLRREQEAAARKMAEELAAQERAKLLERQAEAVFDGDADEADRAARAAANVEPLNMIVPEVQIPVNGISTRETWRARVVDFAALPDQFKQPNEREIARFAQLSKGATKIPGLEFYSEKGINSRSK